MLIRFFKVCLLLILSVTAICCVSLREVHSVGSKSKPTPEHNEKPIGGKTSHFVCWNVHKAKHLSFQDDLKGLLAAFPDKEDVTLCMQEVRGNTFDLIDNLIPQNVGGHYAPSWRFSFSKRSTGVLTVGRGSLPPSGAVPLKSPRREFYVASPKVSLSTETSLPDGRKLQVINCHGLNFVLISVFPKQLDEIFGALADTDAPAIVCGDFNVWSQRRLEILEEKAKAAGLSEARSSCPGHSPAPKWLGFLNRLNGFDPEIPLDRIYTRGIEVIDCKTHSDTTSSDHYPLVLSYKVYATNTHTLSLPR